jgi:ribosomal protein L28
MKYQASMIFENELTPRNGVKIPFGIHSKCKITSIEHVVGEHTDINFEDSEGRYHNKRLWAPNGNYPKTVKLPDGTEKMETVEQATLREGSARLTHLLKIADLLGLKETVSALPALDYDPFVEKVISLIKPKLSTEFNLKLIYDSEGMYSVFGNFPDYIELHVEGVVPKLQYTSWEKENRCTYKGKSDTDKPDNSAELDDLFKSK